MELYIIRHGIAGDRDPIKYPNDEERPLTEPGRMRTKKVAQQLKEKELWFDIILTSPLVRAHQTAEILQKEGLCDRVEEFAALSPDGDIQTWVNWWLESKYNKENSCIALVGHQPDLGNWAEILIWGSPKEKLILKKAGIFGLLLPEGETPIGNSQLFLLTSPKWLL
ncbi:phosphohistidine phosphatase SixA [Candidatus Gracilibacteria bacterium]|nr:phosphohistidine phosphatase SixA [Candidatus Gracilibacteria bacterium]NJM86699.1 phosphohistidine phosphatase SixA [Hydrococcus sp. RU_2_2]NJP21550.1 phosphohistidine phosphatase SixA [Hydrococcus sp. CRU_1_1]